MKRNFVNKNESFLDESEQGPTRLFGQQVLARFSEFREKLGQQALSMVRRRRRFNNR